MSVGAAAVGAAVQGLVPLLAYEKIIPSKHVFMQSYTESLTATDCHVTKKRLFQEWPGCGNMDGGSREPCCRQCCGRTRQLFASRSVGIIKMYKCDQDVSFEIVDAIKFTAIVF